MGDGRGIVARSMPGISQDAGGRFVTAEALVVGCPDNGNRIGSHLMPHFCLRSGRADGNSRCSQRRVAGCGSAYRKRWSQGRLRLPHPERHHHRVTQPNHPGAELQLGESPPARVGGDQRLPHGPTVRRAEARRRGQSAEVTR